MGNLLLRVGFALAIVAAAIGMTAAASETVTRCDANVAAVTASDGSRGCTAETTGTTTAVAGYQAAPNTADRAAAASPSLVQEATLLVALATGAVLFCIFVILLMYRQRPGGVRAPNR